MRQFLLLCLTSHVVCQDHETEPLLKENPNRFVLLPIQYPDIWAMYKKAEGRRN